MLLLLDELCRFMTAAALRAEQCDALLSASGVAGWPECLARSRRMRARACSRDQREGLLCFCACTLVRLYASVRLRYPGTRGPFPLWSKGAKAAMTHGDGLIDDMQRNARWSASEHRSRFVLSRTRRTQQVQLCSIEVVRSAAGTVERQSSDGEAV